MQPGRGRAPAEGQLIAPHPAIAGGVGGEAKGRADLLGDEPGTARISTGLDDHSLGVAGERLAGVAELEVIDLGPSRASPAGVTTEVYLVDSILGKREVALPADIDVTSRCQRTLERGVTGHTNIARHIDDGIDLVLTSDGEVPLHIDKEVLRGVVEVEPGVVQIEVVEIEPRRHAGGNNLGLVADAAVVEVVIPGPEAVAAVAGTAGTTPLLAAHQITKGWNQHSGGRRHTDAFRGGIGKDVFAGGEGGFINNLAVSFQTDVLRAQLTPKHHSILEGCISFCIIGPRKLVAAGQRHVTHDIYLKTGSRLQL
ncbi:hypothetical protein D3C84_332680 [compost metagenome]